jgi:hypothetical protein
VAKQLTEAEIHRLARMGAAAKLAQLEREIASLKRAFPGLKPQSAPVPPPPSDGPTHITPNPAVPRHRRRTPMNAAERKAVSEGMKRYWDARRKPVDK